MSLVPLNILSSEQERLRMIVSGDACLTQCAEKHLRMRHSGFGSLLSSNVAWLSALGPVLNDPASAKGISMKDVSKFSIPSGLTNNYIPMDAKHLHMRKSHSLSEKIPTSC